MPVVLSFIWCVTHAVAARWVYRDATRHGHGGWQAVALVSFLWPVGFPLWIMIRSGLHLAPEGGGSAWG